jgi:hypothetical protein
MLARSKHSSLLRKFVTYGRKKLYNIGPWSYPQKLDYARRPAREKQSSLLRTHVNYGRKNIYNIGRQTRAETWRRKNVEPRNVENPSRRF